MGLRRLVSRVVVLLLAFGFYVMLKTYSLSSSSSRHEPVDLRHEIIPHLNEFSLPQHSIIINQSQNAALIVHQNQSQHSNSSRQEGKNIDIVDTTHNETCLRQWLGVPPSISNSRDLRDFDTVTCKALLFGDISDQNDQAIYQHARKFMDGHKKKQMSDSYFIDNIQDIGCSQFKLSRGYHLTPVSKEEEEFPIAYNLLVHRDIWQVEILLRSIYRPQNLYCIHIDAKVKPELLDSIRALASCFSNVYIASRLEKITWAGYSRLQADINCMKDQVKKTVKWKYLINSAGQAFPLKSNLEMVKILKIYNGANDIEGIYGKRVHRSRFENEWKENFTVSNQGKLVKTGKKNPKPPYDIDIVRGSAYGIFSRNFVEWLLTDEKAKALLEWSRNTWSPDEHYWATLHHQYANPHIKSPGGYSGEPNKKPWLAVWAAWGGMDKCHGRWMRGVCVFGIEDLPSLVDRRELMLNKVSIEVEPLGLECLQRWIEYKSECQPKFDETYYKGLPYILKS